MLPSTKNVEEPGDVRLEKLRAGDWVGSDYSTALVNFWSAVGVAKCVKRVWASCKIECPDGSQL